MALSGFGAVASLVLTVGLLSVSPYLSFVAFVAAVGLALVSERHARTLGRQSLEQLSENVRHRFGQSSPRGDH